MFAELTKPSQSVITIISSVGTDPFSFALVIELLQETIAGDGVSRSFRPDIPGNEYPTPNTKPPTPSQDFEEYGEPTDRGVSQISFNPDDLYDPHFSSRSPTPNKSQGRKPLADPGRSNQKEARVVTSYGEWKPEQLSNGNYRRVCSLSLGPDPYLV